MLISVYVCMLIPCLDVPRKFLCFVLSRLIKALLYPHMCILPNRPCPSYPSIFVSAPRRKCPGRNSHKTLVLFAGVLDCYSNLVDPDIRVIGRPSIRLQIRYARMCNSDLQLFHNSSTVPEVFT